MMSDAERLNHILERIGEIDESLNVSFEEYSGNKDKQAALFAHLVIIGEAAGRLSRELRDKYPEVSWKNAVGLRNILVHDYVRVDYEVLWETAMNDLPVLKKQIQRILEDISEK